MKNIQKKSWKILVNIWNSTNKMENMMKLIEIYSLYYIYL